MDSEINFSSDFPLYCGFSLPMWRKEAGWQQTSILLVIQLKTCLSFMFLLLQLEMLFKAGSGIRFTSVSTVVFLAAIHCHMYCFVATVMPVVVSFYALNRVWKICHEVYKYQNEKSKTL